MVQYLHASIELFVLGAAQDTSNRTTIGGFMGLLDGFRQRDIKETQYQTNSAKGCGFSLLPDPVCFTLKHAGYL